MKDGVHGYLRLWHDRGLGNQRNFRNRTFFSLVPKTSANFLHLCIGDRGLGKCGKKLHYKDSFFHRVIPASWPRAVILRGVMERAGKRLRG